MPTFKTLEVLPTKLYKFKIPQNIWNKIKKEVDNIKWEEQAFKRDNQEYYGLSTKGMESLHRQKNWKRIVTYIENSLKEVVEDIGYSLIEELKVCLMWANKSNTQEWHHRHTHPWSILSGIIYVQGEDGKTWFSRETDYRELSKNTQVINLGLNPNTDEKAHIIHKHKPENGTMIIFPSTLEHSVDNNMSDIARITLSFNTFPNGTVGKIENLSGLSIKVV